MKKLKTNFRKIKAGMALAFITCFMFLNNANAQTMVLPTNSDNFWFRYPVGVSILGINTAVIAGGAGYIIAAASTHDDHPYVTKSGKIYISDPNIPSSDSILLYTGSSYAAVSDIAIGNSTGGLTTICPLCNSSVNYILAAAFVNISGYVEIEFFNVYDDGVNPIIITSLSSDILSGYSYIPNYIHIDAIADYYAGGGACHKFVVTWDDFTTPGSPLVWAVYGDFNTGILSTPVQINPTFPAIYGDAPDIAGVQTNVSGNIDDVAYIAYIDPTSNSLYCQEYDFTTNAPVARTTLNSGVSNQSPPRIDAIDNYNYNSTNTNANWEIVNSVYNGSIYQIHSYDNVYSSYVPSSVIYIPAAGVAPYTSYSGPADNSHGPTVSVADDGTGTHSYNYSVLHYFFYGGGFEDILFMEPLNFAASNALWNNDYYWVNGDITTNSGVPTITDGDENGYITATSSAPNDPTQPTLYAWVHLGVSTGIDSVSYKLSTSNNGAPPYYQFRQASSNNSATTNQQLPLLIYPNPATEQLTVQNAFGKNASTSYCIFDVTGRKLLKGNLQTNSTTIDVGMLAAGTYVIKMFNGESEDGSMLFVKN